MPIQQMLLGTGGVSEVTGQFLLSGNYTSGYSWTVPADVTSISVVAIGAGAGATMGVGGTGYSGAGGALAYANNIPVTPGATLTLITQTPNSTHTSGFYSSIAGPASGSQAAWTLKANGGNYRVGGTREATGNPGSVTSTTPPGGDGGAGAWTDNWGFLVAWAGGGGAGGYGAAGGRGGYLTNCSGWGCTATFYAAGTGGNGGGGGGGHGKHNTYRGGGGGGTAPYGQGTGGSGGASQTGGGNGNGTRGQGGSYVSGLSGGTPTTNTEDGDECWDGGEFGGGCGTAQTWTLYSGTEPEPGKGCVRIIWPGDSRQFPSTRTADE